MPTESPAAWQRADQLRSSDGVASSSGASVEGMGIVRKPTLADVVGVRAGRLDDHLTQVGVRLDELRRRAAEMTGDAEEVVNHQHLGVAVGPGTDADRGNHELPAHLRSQVAQDALEDDRESTRILERVCI